MNVSTSKRLAVTGAAAAMVALLAIAVTLTVGVGHAWASAWDYDQHINYMKKNTTINSAFYDMTKTSCEYANHYRFVGSEKTLKLVSADKKLKVTVNNDWDAGRWSDERNWIDVKIKKPGTSKMVFKAGKKKYTVTIKAPKFTFPLKSLTIGGKDYKADLEKDFYTGLWGTSAIDVPEFDGLQYNAVAAKGWKLEADAWGSEVKNGDILDGSPIVVNATNKKTGMGLAFAINPAY